MFFRRSIILTCTAVIAAFAIAPARAADKTCIDCHKKVISKRVIHAAVSQYARMEQGCDTCHTAPHANKKGGLSLAAPVPELCYRCHDKAGFSKENVHPPVAAGDCLTCHDPHSSEAPRLLNQQVPAICHNCHPDKVNGRHILAGYGFGDNHPVQGRTDPTRKGRELGCVSCHDPHASSKKFLFVNDGTAGPDNLCLLCHTRITVRP